MCGQLGVPSTDSEAVPRPSQLGCKFWVDRHDGCRKPWVSLQEAVGLAGPCVLTWAQLWVLGASVKWALVLVGSQAHVRVSTLSRVGTKGGQSL